MKLAYLAATAAVTLVATPAAAANVRVSREPTPVVRVNVIGKTDAQVAAEIKAAAATVCSATFSPCVEAATANANRQYAAIKRALGGAGGTRVEVVREARHSIRVKVAGRSIEQINADIAVAAKTVCKSVGGPDYRNCIDQASRDAKSQLRDLQIASAEKFAAR